MNIWSNLRPGAVLKISAVDADIELTLALQEIGEALTPALRARIARARRLAQAFAEAGLRPRAADDAFPTRAARPRCWTCAFRRPRPAVPACPRPTPPPATRPARAAE